MHFLAIILVPMYLGLLGEAYGMRDIESLKSYSNYESISNVQSQNSMAALPIQSIDDFLDKLVDKYSSINEEIESIMETSGKMLSEVPVDCTSPRASELIAEKETFDYCHNLTVQMKELKNLTEQSLNLFFDIGYATSIIVSNGIECHQNTSPFSKLNCYMSLYRYTRNYLTNNLPKIMKIAEELKVMANILTIDGLNCFFHHNIDQQTAKEIAIISLKCDVNAFVQSTE